MGYYNMYVSFCLFKQLISSLEHHVFEGLYPLQGLSLTADEAQSQLSI